MMQTIDAFFAEIPIYLNILFFLIGLVFLVKGSDFFVDAAVFFAKKFKVSEVIIGLTLVSIGTSLPELATNINSALKGRTAIAIGNILGSNITNIALVAGVAALIVGKIVFDKKLFTRDIPIMLGATAVIGAFIFLFDGPDYKVNRFEALGMVVLLVLYLIYLLKTHHVEDEVDEEEHHVTSMIVAILLFIGGFLGIFLGSELMVRNVIEIAREFHISDGIIGATVVALGTSLPELSVTIMGIIKKRANLSLGNIVGSNIFNILGILGITGLIRDISLIDGLSGKPDMAALLFVFPFCAIISLLLCLFMRIRWQLERYEGVILVFLYGTFLFFNFAGVPYLP